MNITFSSIAAECVCFSFSISLCSWLIEFSRLLMVLFFSSLESFSLAISRLLQLIDSLHFSISRSSPFISASFSSTTPFSLADSWLWEVFSLSIWPLSLLIVSRCSRISLDCCLHWVLHPARSVYVSLNCFSLKYTKSFQVTYT